MPDLTEPNPRLGPARVGECYFCASMGKVWYRKDHGGAILVWCRPCCGTGHMDDEKVRKDQNFVELNPEWAGNAVARTSMFIPSRVYPWPKGKEEGQ